jgi:holliday junction DNA helicase RuvA
MIGYLHGKLISKNLDSSSCTLLCGDIGYEIMVPRSFSETATLQLFFPLWIHTHVREDALTLFGFTTENERSFFKLLLGLSGLGPKGALSLISEHGAQGLAALIIRQDADAISSAPGIGKKLAQRVILDLQSKVEKLAWLDALPSSQKVEKSKKLSGSDQRREDLSSALQNLGFTPQTVRGVLEKLETSEQWAQQSFESSLRMALKELSRHAMNLEAVETGGAHA